MFGFLENSTSESEIVAIFDIGSGSVGGAIVQIPILADREDISESDIQPTILYSVRRMSDVSHASSNDHLDRTQRVIHEVADMLYKSTVAVPVRAYCIVSSPWCASENRLIQFSREDSFVFTKRLSSEIIAKEIASIKSSHQKMYGPDNTLEIIEHLVTSVKIDGSLVGNPIGVSAKSVEIEMFVSACPTLFLGKMKESIEHSFNSMPIIFSSFATSSCVAAFCLYEDQHSFLLLNMREEYTEICLVSGAMRIEVDSFPCGKNTLMRAISHDIGRSTRDTKELVGLYMAGSLDAKLHHEMKSHIKKSEIMWRKLLQDCALLTQGNNDIPDTVFVVADDDILRWFLQMLHSMRETMYGARGEKFTMHTLDRSRCLSFCRTRNHEGDLLLMIEAIGITHKLQTLQYA